MRVLHVGFHHGDGRIPEDESQSHARRSWRTASREPCRCQDYDKILNAMMRGAENMRKVSAAIKRDPEPWRYTQEAR